MSSPQTSASLESLREPLSGAASGIYRESLTWFGLGPQGVLHVHFHEFIVSLLGQLDYSHLGHGKICIMGSSSTLTMSFCALKFLFNSHNYYEMGTSIVSIW